MLIHLANVVLSTGKSNIIIPSELVVYISLDAISDLCTVPDKEVLP